MVPATWASVASYCIWYCPMAFAFVLRLEHRNSEMSDSFLCTLTAKLIDAGCAGKHKGARVTAPKSICICTGQHRPQMILGYMKRSLCILKGSDSELETANMISFPFSGCIFHGTEPYIFLSFFVSWEADTARHSAVAFQWDSSRQVCWGSVN